MPTEKDQQGEAGAGTLSDHELLEDYRDHGRQAALAELVRRYQTRLFRVILGMVADSGLAEELTQQAFVKAATRLDQLRDGQAFYAWLITIARSVTFDELRRRQRRPTGLLEGGAPPVEPSTQPTHDVKQAVRATLAALTPEERLVIILADLQGLSMKEIAVAVGLGLSATKMRLQRARARFRELYEHGAP